MPKMSFPQLILFALCVSCLARSARGQVVVSEHFPGRQNVGIVCWTVPEKGVGYLSQIVVFGAGPQQVMRSFWESPIENAYSPQIRFIQEIKTDGLPLAIVERQTGAASSQLDVIGESRGHIARLLQLDGFKFDVEFLDGEKLPSLIAHVDASVLDVPEIYRWNGSRFARDSASHPEYYTQLLAEDQKKLPPGSSADVLLNLSRIAVLARDRRAARLILGEALSRERGKGQNADKETISLIAQALRSLAKHEPDERSSPPPTH